MSESSSWSLQIWHSRGLHLRVHALFIVVAVLTLYLSVSPPGAPALAYGVLSVVILGLSVLAHEIGHCCAALRVGGNTDQLVIGPLGGLSRFDVPRERQAELTTALAGPLVNLAIALLCLPLLLAARVSVTGLLNPLVPLALTEGAWWTVVLKLTFWINWLLLVVNLLPAIPFDGARILRGALYPALDARGANLVAVRISKLAVFGLCLLAWFLRNVHSAEVLPTWVPLLLFATFVYFSAQQEADRQEESPWEDDLFAYDFSQGYTSLERAMEPPRRQGGSLRRWLEQRRQARKLKQQFQEQDEERQVDEILQRLHEHGMERLSAKERSLLDRVSARIRNRLKS